MASSKPAAGDEQNEAPKKGRKKSGKKEKDVFCYCRKGEGRFMIGCDGCEEWYHGDCIQLTSAQSKEIDVYFCPTCISNDSNLKIKYFKDKIKTEEGPAPHTERCNECLNCVKMPDCGKCPQCTSKIGRCITIKCLSISANNVATSGNAVERKQRPTKLRKPPAEIKEGEPDDAFLLDAYPPTPTSRKSGGRGVAVAVKKISRATKNEKCIKKEEEDEEYVPQSRSRCKADVDKVAREIQTSQPYMDWQARANGQLKERAPRMEPVQCLGPGCVYAARTPRSKYCSDRCGMNLAKARIAAYLPQALNDYHKVEPVEAKRVKEKEAREAKEIDELNADKTNLDKWHKMVIDYVNALKVIKPDEEPMEELEPETLVFCAVCTFEYGSRSIKKHLEKCFAKSEKLETYGTSTKCLSIPWGIFCEELNPCDKTYCKRLRVICPDHYKGEVEEGLQVCGWPKTWSAHGSKTMDQLLVSMDDLINGGQCGIYRKECKNHVGWITSILGSIDARRIAYYTRMEELIEAKKKRVKEGDALLLMSNHTEYNQPLEKILMEYDKAVKEGRGGPSISHLH